VRLRQVSRIIDRARVLEERLKGADDAELRWKVMSNWPPENARPGWPAGPLAADALRFAARPDIVVCFVANQRAFQIRPFCDRELSGRRGLLHAGLGMFHAETLLATPSSNFSASPNPERHGPFRILALNTKLSGQSRPHIGLVLQLC